MADEPQSEIVFYQGEDGESRIQVRLENETVWLSQRLMAELFQVEVPTLNEHIQHIFEEGELDPGPTIRKFRIVQPVFWNCFSVSPGNPTMISVVNRPPLTILR